MIKKILVALDGSESSWHALNVSLDVAGQVSAEIQLLAVVPPVFLPAYSIYVVKSEAINECAKELETSFEGVLTKAKSEAQKKKPNLKVTTLLEKGEPYSKIVETAKNGNFDLIVVGSRGLGGKLTALGSVSSRVVDEASCPVLIIK
jgi:nucleotide-binding universal stress UspA family protein